MDLGDGGDGSFLLCDISVTVRLLILNHQKRKRPEDNLKADDITHQ